MTTFQTVTDETLAEQIHSAGERIVFTAPGVTSKVAEALTGAYLRESVAVTVVLDSDEDAYRIGFGDLEGLTTLYKFTLENGRPLRREPGLRIGLLVVDDVATIWSPTPQSLESTRKQGQYNGIILKGVSARKLREAVWDDGVSVPPVEAEGGTKTLLPEETKKMVASLNENPPIPFDLAQKTRVFSTRFHFVETELRGAGWTNRKIKISNLLLNSDLPEDLQEVLETQVRPYQEKADFAIDAPLIVGGQQAFNKDGKKILVPTTQKDIETIWRGIKDRYFVKIQGFGSLIRKIDMTAFREEVDAFENLLQIWIEKFHQNIKNDEEEIIQTLVRSMQVRIQRSARKTEYQKFNLAEEVRAGFKKMRVVDPHVRIVIKDVSWESTRDEEFTEALRQALPDEEMQNWFKEFMAVPETTLGEISP